MFVVFRVRGIGNRERATEPLGWMSLRRRGVYPSACQGGRPPISRYPASVRKPFFVVGCLLSRRTFPDDLAWRIGRPPLDLKDRRASLILRLGAPDWFCVFSCGP